MLLLRGGLVGHRIAVDGYSSIGRMRTELLYPCSHHTLVKVLRCLRRV